MKVKSLEYLMAVSECSVHELYQQIDSATPLLCDHLLFRAADCHLKVFRIFCK